MIRHSGGVRIDTQTTGLRASGRLVDSIGLGSCTSGYEFYGSYGQQLKATNSINWLESTRRNTGVCGVVYVGYNDHCVLGRWSRSEILSSFLAKWPRSVHEILRFSGEMDCPFSIFDVLNIRSPFHALKYWTLSTKTSSITTNWKLDVKFYNNFKTTLNEARFPPVLVRTVPLFLRILKVLFSFPKLTIYVYQYLLRKKTTNSDRHLGTEAGPNHFRNKMSNWQVLTLNGHNYQNALILRCKNFPLLLSCLRNNFLNARN